MTRERAFGPRDSLAGPVAGVLPQAGQRVEHRALAGVGIAGERHHVAPPLSHGTGAAGDSRRERNGHLRPPRGLRRAARAPTTPDGAAARSARRERGTRWARRARWSFRP